MAASLRPENPPHSRSVVRQWLDERRLSANICNSRTRGHGGGRRRMCRNIKTLFNFEPPVNAEEIRAASLQFVRKISGFNKPSKANEASFLAAVDEISAISASFLRSLEINAPPKNREEEAAKAKARAATRDF